MKLHKPFAQLRRKELQVYTTAALSLLGEATTFSNDNGYIFATRASNPELFEYLDELQFFAFQTTNKKREIVGVHQITLWLHRGVYCWRYNKHVMQESERVEVHHRNSITSDNRPDNLLYVTPQQNSLCANAVLKPYYGLRSLHSANIQHWAAFGKGLSDTVALIRDCMLQTLLGFGYTLEQIPSVASIFLQLPVCTGKEIIKHWRLQLNAV